MEELELFDSGIRDQIEGLLGSEAYGERLLALVQEIDEGILEFDGQNLDDQISIVHKISGVSAMLGLKPIHEQLLNAELRAKSGDKDGFHTDWSAFVEAWPERKARIHQQVQS